MASTGHTAVTLASRVGPALCGVIGGMCAVGAFLYGTQTPVEHGHARQTDLSEKTVTTLHADATEDADHVVAPIVLSSEKQQSVQLRAEPAMSGQWARTLQVTGRLELNESRSAHVSALVTGVVREVCVQLGQQVREGDILVYIDSREVGEAKLRFAQDQQELQFAKETCQWFETVHKNTHGLLAALEKGKRTDAIEKEFRDRPIGSDRERLISALARLDHAKAEYERLRSLGEQNVVASKDVIRAKAGYESANACYQSLLEQIRFDSHRQLLVAQQDLKKAQTALAVSRSQLFILGYHAADIAGMDPLAEEERVAYYPVRAPTDGTVIQRHAVLSHYVDACFELFEIADLSTVWVRADVFEKDLGAVHGLHGKSVSFRTASYPNQLFSAKIFSLGDVVDDQTRAARLLALGANGQHLLKPGMFVDIDLNAGHDRDVLQVPASAIQRHEGDTFVFIQRDAERFERRDVKIGRSNSHMVEILAGLHASVPVVVKGGFAMKSEMLSELLVEE